MYILKYTQKLNFKSIKVTINRSSNTFFLALPLGSGQLTLGTTELDSDPIVRDDGGGEEDMVHVFRLKGPKCSN